TLDFFDALGRTTTRRRLAAPGKIFPIVHPARDGKPGEVKVHFAGNASTRARIEVAYKEKNAERPSRIARDLARIEASAAGVSRGGARGSAVGDRSRRGGEGRPRGWPRRRRARRARTAARRRPVPRRALVRSRGSRRRQREREGRPRAPCDRDDWRVHAVERP